MKLTTHVNRLAFAFLFWLGALFNCHAVPDVTFSWPIEGQGIVTFSGIAGTATSSGQTLQEVVFSIQDQSTGQYWNGTGYQGTTVWLPTVLAATSWGPASTVPLPAVACGHQYQLSAQARDAAPSTNTVTITVHADAVEPIINFTSLTDGQTVSDLSAMGGTVSDNLNSVQSVVFSIHELDINGGPGRWWNGTQFQTDAVSIPALVAGGSWSRASSQSLPSLNSGQSYELTATATDTTCNSHSVTITVHAPIAQLSWDPGQTPVGTVLMSNPNLNGGNYWFKIVPQNPSVGVWRTVLTVQAGEADVYLSQSSPPTIPIHGYGSSRVGSDGFVLDASQFDPAQEWFILVHASPEAQWSLASGDAFVVDLGPVAVDGSSGATTSIGPEGMLFFKTTVDSQTTAWRLWLQGAQNRMFVKKSLAPHPVSYELVQDGQMLVVPPYLAGTFSGTYFIGVAGDPGSTINLDSRKHGVTDLAFNSLTNLTVGPSDYPYLTFRVQVPVQQIAWQLNLTPAAGRPNIAVRRDVIPNEFRNDAFSETPVGVGASVTLVPPRPDAGPDAPGLSDGTFFVTVYSTGPFACGFSNSNPVITDVPYLFAVTNDTPTRAGWRYYRVSNIAEQLGSLGWELLLSNQVAGTEIALRRNAVPGRWTKRNFDNDFSLSETLGNVDYSGTGFLQRPGHQADIWYIGVYTPAAALGNFALSGHLLTGQLAAFDGAGSTVTVTSEPAGRWRFFRFDVPSGALGWDLRIVGITAGNPRMVVSRDTLPVSLETAPWPWWQPIGSTDWPSGYQWGSYGWDSQWSGCSSLPMMAMGMGNPLQPGTYYVGVKDPDNTTSYTLQSRGIGTGYAIPARDLDFSAGTQSGTLTVTEGDYYRVVVPGEINGWKLKLAATTGDLLMKVQKDFLPNSGHYAEYGGVYHAQGGQPMIKSGNEHWALTPSSDTTLPGTYYVVVVGQGHDLADNCNRPATGWGTGSSSYQLSSRLMMPTFLAGTLSYGNDLIVTNSQQGGEMQFYQFDVPAGIASVELRLEDRVGNPVMYLNEGPMWSGTRDLTSSVRDPYGNYGGTNHLWRDTSLITVPNARGTYKLSVFASHDGTENFPDASYVLRVHAVPPTLVAFDGGSASMYDQPAGTWHFFQVNVPADALGWDVRVVGITNGKPQMVVCRDALPGSLETTPWVWWYPMASTEWPAGYQWGLYGWDAQWSGCGSVPVLAMGMGNPLQPGTYYIGVKEPNNVSSYTVQSRGIGGSYGIPVRDLNYASGVHSGTLAVAEGDYFRVVLPDGLPDWKLKLHAQTGDVLLKVQKDFLPHSGNNSGYGGAYGHQGGQPMVKAGDEQWALMPEPGKSTVTPGTYYAVVVGQGQDTTNHCRGPGSGWGGGSSSYELRSVVEPPTVLSGTLSYGNDLVITNAQQGGEMKFYQFDVPAGIASVELRLENRVGNPVMYLNEGPSLSGTRDMTSSDRDPYGNYGGTNHLWRDQNLITVANAKGTYKLSVFASSDESQNFSDASYVLRVHAAPPTLVPFDGGSASVADQPVGTWHFFQVNVPADALGWDVRVVGVTNGNPHMVLCRDALPNTLETTPWVWWQPMASTEWPAGYQWGMYGWDAQWSGCGSVPVLAMGMGNPLQPGTYYIGVKDPNNVSSYTVQSRGIGGSYSIPVRDLDYASGVHNGNLAVAEGDYFRVVLPDGLPDWKLKLHAQTGDVLLKVQKDFLPHSGNNSGYGGAYGHQGGQPMVKAGDEQWALMPEPGESTVTPGTYYAVVVGQGQDTTNHCRGPGSGWGGGPSSYQLSSMVETPTVPPGVLGYDDDLVSSGSAQGGEVRFYQFGVPAGTPAIEVRLENRVGNPIMYLNQGPVPTGTRDMTSSDRDPYGNYGGTNHMWREGNLITVPNPQSAVYSLSVVASKVSEDHPDASYVLRVRAPVIPVLNFSSQLNTNGQTNVVSGVLADNQRAFYQVMVPASVEGAPVLGWKLDLTALNGTPSVRVRKDLLPEEGLWNGTSPFNEPAATIVPPYLSPGTWYVEVKGGGATTYALNSSVITTNTLDHPLWVMPELGRTTVAPGLTFPAIGDSGIDAAGNPLPGDQGIDLEQGYFDYYAVLVPTNNAGVMRTELQAISGNPNLYLRAGAAPTLAHNSVGVYGDQLYERSLTGNTTEYGNWVPLNGRYESRLTPGIWVLAVQAGGNANARYRLLITCGNPTASGLVQDLALDGGSLTGQNLNGGDWRYYRVQIPSNAPANWVITWSRSLGSARMFVRDTAPPGDGNQTRDYSDPKYNPGLQWHPDLQTWNTDQKNQGPYPRFDAPGTYQISPPPLRPGSVYYLGFWSPSDSTFSVSSSTSGGPVVVTNAIAFNGGLINAILPPYGSSRYRIEVPAGASRIMLNANNSANVVLALEQGTLAQAGSPAHWSSYSFPWGPNQANAALNQSLLLPNNWPWLPGAVYYLAATNTSGAAEAFTAGFAGISDLAPIRVIAPPVVMSTQPSPSVSLAWCVTNAGTATTTANWYDRVWFSTNNALDSYSVSLGDFWFGQSLAAGSSYWFTNTVTLPLQRSADYWIFVEADFQNQIPELNKSNNVSQPIAGHFELELLRPTLDCVVGAAGLSFTWSGPYVLQSAINANGPYVDIPEASSPYNAAIAPKDQRFFRLRGPVQ